MSRIDEILGRMDALEKELRVELRDMKSEFLYTVQKKKVRFSAEVRAAHRELAAKWSDYVYDSGVWVMLTLPFIFMPLIPALMIDVSVWLYQLMCFPVYGIPRVKRRDYVVIDRHSLKYLNLIEKVNCYYCGYFNGLIGFVREVAARTEQYWCPIRHARPVKSVHSRYRHFFPYGDAKGYREGLNEVRTRFDDV
ncbi:hypothetical protein [Maridesulfovibrio salexigens]|uniref:Uncharacterized protein n=1 Tax=Maridesulfovibrio salexigens (strain ATCC 14822 / DSM 2638 / NCIMB 8403 / VKM B-1763) TaxID=526222 RepID=C6BZ37_MARSD|nr:hypothetical protein [Maridesulfovibrio salexigens]ACS78861.1 conserved hypothetical protein [Maridesulfovibrio salexigens DSM 2638]